MKQEAVQISGQKRTESVSTASDKRLLKFIKMLKAVCLQIPKTFLLEVYSFLLYRVYLKELFLLK